MIGHSIKEVVKNMYQFRVRTGSLESFNLETKHYRRHNHKLFINNLVFLYFPHYLFLTGFDQPSNQVYTYDLKNAEVNRLQDMIVPRKCHSLVHFNGEVLAIGGLSGIVKQNSCETYCQGSWELIAPMNVRRAYCSSITMPNGVYVFGDTIDRSIELYLNRKWSVLTVKLSHETANVGLLQASDDSIIVIGGGSALVGYSKQVDEVDFDLGILSEIGELGEEDSFKGFTASWNGKQFIIGNRGLYQYDGSLEVFKNRSLCRLCMRWECDGKCNFYRRKVALFLRFRAVKLHLL